MSEEQTQLEKNFLACAYLDGATIDAGVSSGLGATCFTYGPHAEQFRFLCELRLSGKDTSIESVFAESRTNGRFNALGGAQAIFDAANAQPTITFASGFVRALLDAHGKRQALLHLSAAVESIKSGTATLEGIKATAERVTEVCSSQQSVHRSIGDIDNDAAAKIKAATSEAPDESQLIKWGIPKVDRFMMPIERHEYVLIAARPSRGKSSLLAHLAMTNLVRKLKVAYFTLETSDTSVFMQIAGQRCGLNVHRDGIRQWTPQEHKRFEDARNYLKTSGRLLVFDKDMTLEAVQARCRLLAANYKPDLVVLDYLGLVRSEGKSIYERVSNASKAMIPLKKLLGCALVVGQQLKRAENDAAEPTLSDLRDSGQLEEDAHRVVMPHWKESKHLDQQHRPYIFLQPKLRDGPTTAVDGITFHAPTTRFYEESGLN